MGEDPAGEPVTPRLDAQQAESFARLALANIGHEYPAKLDHVLSGDESLAPPRALFPVFHGSFDWHSCVHGHWMLARLLRLHPGLGSAPEIRRLFDTRFTETSVTCELAYLTRPESAAFERTYGWAWLLKLCEELTLLRTDDGSRWRRVLAPLADAFVARYFDYLPKATYPIRHGVHSNSAFGLCFALDYARTCGFEALGDLVIVKARAWFGGDTDAPAAWEPSGTDFLSPSLIEADLMRRMLPADAFGEWLQGFLPGIVSEQPASLFAPVSVSDRSDGYIVHLDGLNLSRAWCWEAIAAALPLSDARAAIARSAATRHRRAGMEGVASGDYAGDHWLATFAVLSMTATDQSNVNLTAFRTP